MKGASGPLEGELHSARYFHGRFDLFVDGFFDDIIDSLVVRDGLGGITERHPDLNVDSTDLFRDYPWFQHSDKSGAELALDLIQTYPERSISYIVLGPLTNLAALLRLNPKQVQNRIGRAFCMGGALDVPGNTNPVSECASLESVSGINLTIHTRSS